LNAEKVEILLKELIAQRVRAENPRTVGDLFEIVRIRRPTISEDDFICTINELKESGALELELPPPKVDSYSAYLKVSYENAWFYLTALVALATLLAVYVLPGTYPLVALRWVVGSVFVLFLPGYVTVQALFPKKKELDSVERFALAVGLSLAITPLIGLVLNYTPWGIRLDPIVVALSIFTFSIAVVGTYRRYRSTSRTLTGNP